MKSVMVAASLIMSPSLMASVEGFKDIYLDREQPIHVHSIFCGADLNNLRTLKNSYVYTNTPTIEEGTYYYSSAYGDFSYTFQKIEGQDPSFLMGRGLKTSNQANLVKEYCIVGKVDGLPQQLTRSMNKMTLSVEDPQWDLTMKKLAMFGKPAFGEGVYTDQRTLAKHNAADQAVYDANQAYLAGAKSLFEAQFEEIANTLPKRLADGIAYAYQEDGFIQSKVYPVIEEPLVWTVTAERRYEEQKRQLHQTKQWDKLIQENFDWFFALTQKGNGLSSVALVGASETKINNGVFEKVSTVSATFDDGKTLELDFVITSEQLPDAVFWSLADIQQKALALRNSMVVRTKRELEALKPPESLDVYSDAERMVLFFSPFREKSLGDKYRYF